MAAYANVPVNSPSVLHRLPGMLLDPSSPLSIKLTAHLPSMLPWAALFAWNCRPSAVEHTAKALGALLSRADAGYEAVWKQAGIDIDGAMGVHASSDADGQREKPFAVREGYLLLQRSEAAMKASEAGAALRSRHVANLRMEALSSDEVAELEPALAPSCRVGGAWFFPDGWFLNEPGALLRALASGFEGGGGELSTGAAVLRIVQSSGGGACVVLEDGTRIEADEVVVAAGAHSAALVSDSLGEFCPLDTERGYHVGFGEGSERLLTRAVCDPSVGWIASPMAGGLRVAGKVELGGTHAPPTPARWDAIERETRAMLDGACGHRLQDSDWLGFRPTMPDALPVIGRSRTLPSVFYAFGHQHVGWTLGGITGELIAQLVQGKEPSVDLSPYSLDRFRVGFHTHSRRASAAASATAWHGTGGATAGVSAMGRRGAATLAGGARRGMCSFSSSSPSSGVKRPLPTMMRHTTYTPGCAAHELGVGESPLPPVGAGDVLIQVEYSGVGGTDFAQRKGNFNPKPGSPAHHLIMGLEVSGLVAKVGEDVTDFKEGDRVCSLLYGGGYAQYAVAPQQQVLELPDELSMQQGAAVPENFWTVWANLFEPAFGNLFERPKEKTLLVHGGAGGIGSTALTLASAFGVRTITTVSSAEKAEAARRFGAHVAIDYTTHDFVEAVMEATDGRGADVVLCFLGGDYMPRNVAALANYGRLVQLGVRRGKDVTFDFKALMNKWGVVTGGHLRPRTLEQKHATRNALREHVLPRWRDGTLPKPEVMRTLSLAEAGTAHAMLEEGQVVGKVVLEP